MNAIVHPRRYKASYAPSMAAEMKKNVELLPGEELLFETAIKQKKNWLLWSPGILWLTNCRVALLEHHLFTGDWILELPPQAIAAVQCEEDDPNDCIAVDYSSDGGAFRLLLLPFFLRSRPSREERGALLNALRKFQQHSALEERRP
jgi:hypothetical protein